MPYQGERHTHQPGGWPSGHSAFQEAVRVSFRLDYRHIFCHGIYAAFARTYLYQTVHMSLFPLQKAFHFLLGTGTSWPHFQ